MLHPIKPISMIRQACWRSAVGARTVALGLLAVASAGPASENWPDFRGPAGDGHVAGDATLPMTWSESENVVWKTPVPHKGWSTPVVWGDQVWLTTATEEGHDFFVIALDRESGSVLHNEQLFHSDTPEPLGNNVNCYASPSPVIEAGRVYVHFGSYGTACIDTKTNKVLWKREDLPCRHYRGPGSSPIIFGDSLILTFDGIDQQYLTALDKHTGKTLWRTDRTRHWQDLDDNGEPKRGGDLRKAFSTPVIVTQNGAPHMLSVGSSATYGYDPHTGKELWKVEQIGFTPSTRPVWDGERLFTATGYGGTELWAIRTDGQGDVSKSHVDWRRAENDVPDTPSPILVDGLLYVVSNRGQLTCLEPATGEVVWADRIGGNYIASPIVSNGLIYYFNSQGGSHIVGAGRTFNVRAENALDDGLMASPAVSGTSLILRTKTHVYRIEEK